MKIAMNDCIAVARASFRALGVGLGLISLYLSGLVVYFLSKKANQARSDRMNKKAATLLQWHCRYFLRLCGISVVHKGVQPCDFPSSRALILTNHVNYLDVIILAARYRLGFMAKDEVRQWDLLGPLIQIMNVIFVKRECTYSRVRSLRELSSKIQGLSYCIFPQGTTSAALSLSEGLWFRGQLFSCYRHSLPSHVFLGSLVYEDHRQLAWIDDMSLLPHLWALLKRKNLLVWLNVEEWTSPLSGIPSLKQRSDVVRRQIDRMLSLEVKSQ